MARLKSVGRLVEGTFVLCFAPCNATKGIQGRVKAGHALQNEQCFLYLQSVLEETIHAFRRKSPVSDEATDLMYTS